MKSENMSDVLSALAVTIILVRLKDFLESLAAILKFTPIIMFKSEAETLKFKA